MNVPELVGWVSATELARWLGVSKQYVHKMIKEDKIKTARRIGRELVINTQEAVKLLGARKHGQFIRLDLASGGVANVPCEQVPKLIFWCSDTAKVRGGFTQAARTRLGAPEAADWSAGRQYIGLNPPGQRGKASPTKPEIADYLLAKLRQA